jgi:hypothetical protein
MPVRDREMPAPMYWSVTVIGFVSLGFAIACTLVLVQEGWIGSWDFSLSSYSRPLSTSSTPHSVLPATGPRFSGSGRNTV